MAELPLVGSVLGKYEIKAELGRGGMGSVFLGRDPLLDREVAIKVLAPYLIWDREFVERFLREARAAARLKHPHIVTIYDVGQEEGQYYFVMEHLAGETLSARMQRDGAMAIQDALAILRPLAEALDYAHQQGVVHRDIKPGNIIIGPAGQVTLLDFGIARAAQEGKLTGTGTIVGTPEYMSPEQAKAANVDSQTDQYSLGVVAFQMLSGRVPFQADSTLALMFKVVHEPPPPLADFRPDLPAEVGRALERALAKEPGERYPTASAFVDALEATLVEKPTLEAALPETSTIVTRVTDRRVGRIPVWVWAVGAAAALILTCGLAIALASSILPRIGGDQAATTPPGPEATGVVSVGQQTQGTEPESSPTPTVTAAPEPTLTPTEEPTLAPTPTALEPTPTALEPTPTETPLPEPTATAVTIPSPTLQPSATPRAVRPTATQAPPVAPGQFVLLKPTSADPTTKGMTEFKWQWTSPLQAGQGFEIRVWREGEPQAGVHNAVEDNRQGKVVALGNNTYSLSVDITQAAGVLGRGGDYLWAVVLVQVDPEYKDLGIQSAPGHLYLDLGGGGGGGGGGGDQHPTF